MPIQRAKKFQLRAPQNVHTYSWCYKVRACQKKEDRKKAKGKVYSKKTKLVPQKELHTKP